MKTVIPAVSCLLFLQAFAFALPQNFTEATQNMPFTASISKDFKEESAKISAELADKLNYAAAVSSEQWRKSIVFIEVEVKQQEVTMEGGGPRQRVDDKLAVQTYDITHKHNCLGALVEPGFIVTAGGCFYTQLSGDRFSPSKLTVIEPGSDFPNPAPIKVEKATAVFKSHDGAVIMKQDVTELVRGYNDKETVSWETSANLPKLSMPPAKQDALWQGPLFITCGSGMKYGSSSVKKTGAEGSYILLNVREQKTAGDLVISKDGKYLLGVNRRGRGTPALDFGITTIMRPEIIPAAPLR